MNPITAPLPGTVPDPRYPDEDGRFMGDTDFHNTAMSELWWTLAQHFRQVDVYVTSNLIYYYKEGDPKSRRDPDILVAKGVGKHRRRSYRIWEEKVVPCTLFEIASKRSWRVDIGRRRHLYTDLGVKEYFVFDPEGCFLKPVLQGFRTVRGRSVPMKPAADGSLISKQLGLRLVPEGDMLGLIDVKTGQPVPTRPGKAEQERERVRRLEVERLRALLAKQQRRK
jgi:hypothetical protein